jgi:putative Mg2+ transporter-C (MgtC) family protein
VPTDLSLQLDLSLRLIVAAALGAAVGAERERHGHPAGMRTHLLVALGSALFTVMSAYGFGRADGGAGSPPIDPTRIAAQVVTGIGFLGAGAIIKYGTSIRGLTTAASLWSTAAVGMAIAAGWWLIGGVATAIVLFSLAPLRWVAHRLRGGKRGVRAQLHLAELGALGRVTRSLAAQRVDIVDLDTDHLGQGGLNVHMSILVPARLRVGDVLDELGQLGGVTVVSGEAEID